MILLLLALLTVLTANANATTLSDAAAALAVGQFVQLPPANMPGWNNGLILAPTGCAIRNNQLQFSYKGVWSPLTKTFQHVGSPHQDCAGTNVGMVSYDDATNTWSRGPTPNGSINQPQHSYGHNALDPLTGTHYYKQYNTVILQALTSGGGAWSDISTRPTPGSRVCCTALAWFPGYQGGQVIWVDGDWGVWAYKPSTNVWTHLFRTAGGDGTTLPVVAGLSGQPVFADYSELCQCVVFGKGTSIHRLDLDGSKTQLSLSGGPSSVTCCTGGSSIAVDPVSGKLVILQSGVSYSLDPRGSGTWTTLAISQPPVFAAAGISESLVYASVSNYGVILYLKCDDSSACSAWLYKHAAGNIPAVLPAAPTNLAVQ